MTKQNGFFEHLLERCMIRNSAEYSGHRSVAMAVTANLDHGYGESALKGWAIFLLAVIGLLLVPTADAQTPANAVAAYNGYHSAFYYTGNSSYPDYYTTYITNYNPTNWSFMWQLAYEVSGVEEDSYERLPNATGQAFMTSMITAFEQQNLPNLSWDTWNDDTAWAVLMYARAYPMTNGAIAPSYYDAPQKTTYPAYNYMQLAQLNFDMAYARGWDNTFGGGIWEAGDLTSKCTLSNASFVPAAIMIYQATGDVTYLTKAKALYAWVHDNLMNTTTGAVGECVKTNTGPYPDTNVYNSGLMLNAAAYLYRITGDPRYYNDALLIAGFQVTSHPIMNTDYPYNGPFGADQFYRGLSNFARWNGLWANYSAWFQANATQAWSTRDPKYNISQNNISAQTTNWNTTTPTASNCTPAPPSVMCLSMEYSTSVTLQQMAANQAMVNATSFPGEYEIQNMNSGLALSVAGDSTANGAAIVQNPFSNGDDAFLWTITPTSGGYYTITNVNSGLDLEVSSASALPGANIVQLSSHTLLPGDDQWMPVLNSDGSYTFFNLNSQLVIDAPGQSTAAGKQFDQSFANSGTGQEFNLVQKNTGAPPTITATLTPSLAFTANANTTSAAQVATLQNTSSKPLNGLNISLGGANPSDFAQSASTCVSTLAAGASCTISVTFSAAWPGNYTALLSVADSATGSPQVATLSGTASGAAPNYTATLTPSSLAFTTATVGTASAPQLLTLQNTSPSSLPLTGIGVTIGGTNAGDFQAYQEPGTTCGAVLAAGASCAISVAFTSTTAGSFAATLSVADNATGSPQVATLSGTAGPPSSYAITAGTSSQSVQPGGTATYPITVNPVGGAYSNTVTLSVSGLPPGATASFTPSSVTPGASGATSTLTIQTSATSAATGAERGFALPGALPALSLIGLVFIPAKRRRGWLALVVLFVASLGAIGALSGCGGQSSGASSSSKNYMIIVTGSSGTSTQTTTLQLTML
jgi:hypothetical protein